MNDEMPPLWHGEDLILKCVPYNQQEKIVVWIRPSDYEGWDLSYQEEGKWKWFWSITQENLEAIVRALSAQEKCDPGFIPLEEC